MSSIRALGVEEVLTHGNGSLIYDEKPTFDYFRLIDENTIIAAAENKNKPEGTFFFYLRRGSEKY